jgi:hypothetical protein
MYLHFDNGPWQVGKKKAFAGAIEYTRNRGRAQPAGRHYLSKRRRMIVRLFLFFFSSENGEAGKV